MQVILTKTRAGLIPNGEKSQAWFDKLRLGEDVHGEFKRYRNYRFLKKWFALLNVGFENWNPGDINSKYGAPEKNFDRFRADVTILAGYYITTIRLDGSVRVEPKSVSFAKMEEDEFTELYSKTIDVLIKHVYGSDYTPDQIDELVNNFLRFA